MAAIPVDGGWKRIVEGEKGWRLTKAGHAGIVAET